MRPYLDAAPVIHTVQKIVPLASLVDSWLSQPGVIRIASELTRLECRVKPLRMGDDMLLADFDDFFANDVAEVVASPIRSAFSWKPDLPPGLRRRLAVGFAPARHGASRWEALSEPATGRARLSPGA